MTDESVRRLQAKEDYFNMPKQGKRRSAEGLFNMYVAQHRADPSTRPTIPTLNRNKIYEWRKLDKWDDYCREREEQTIKRVQDLVNEQVDWAYRSLALLTNQAIEVYERAFGHTDIKVALSAATDLLDRVGATKQPVVKTIVAAAAPAAEAPSADADDSELLKYFAERAQNGTKNG